MSKRDWRFNAECFCAICHEKRHRKEPTLEEYKILAESVLGVSLTA